MEAFESPATAPYAKGSASSKGTAEAVAPRLPNQRSKIYHYLVKLLPSGATGEQIEDHFDWHRSSVSTRLGELEVVGYVKRTGRFLPTRSGNEGEVYVAIPRDDPHPPMPKRKTTLRQAAKKVADAFDARDAQGLRDAIANLKIIMKGDTVGSDED